MVTLEETLTMTHEWVVDRLHTLCDCETNNMVESIESIENAHALRMEFTEWLNPDVPDHEIYSLEFLSDK